jgi:hypothetical protein
VETILTHFTMLMEDGFAKVVKIWKKKISF